MCCLIYKFLLILTQKMQISFLKILPENALKFVSKKMRICVKNFAQLHAGELFTAEEREKFETVFSEIKTDASTDTKKQIGVQREYWKKAGVTFDGESKLSLITVYLHSHIDENENSLIAGHAGVLLDTGNEILFFEKISFELPYQLIRFEDRDQLKEYLMRCYDVDTTGECASPFILENDRVL